MDKGVGREYLFSHYGAKRLAADGDFSVGHEVEVADVGCTWMYFLRTPVGMEDVFVASVLTPEGSAVTHSDKVGGQVFTTV